MQRYPEARRAERFVSCSGRIVLECRCGEVVVLLGLRADWYSEGNMLFDCSGCGESLTLADSVYEEAGV